MKKALLFLLLLAGAQTFAQVSLTTTTLSSAVNGSLPNGTTSSTAQTYVFLASLTGVNPPNNTTIRTVLYVDREEMAVSGVSIVTNQVTVLRGYNGTLQSPHNSGATVYVGTPDQFYMFDPIGSCNAPQTKVTPWININTGNQWTCTAGAWTFIGGPYFGGAGIQSYTIGGTLPSPGSAATGTVAAVTNALTQGSCTNGGGSALALCRDSGAAWQPIGDGGSGAAQAGIYAVSYGVVGEGHFSFLFTAALNGTTITCATCNFTTNAKSGQIIYASTLTQSGFSFSTALSLPQTTINSVLSATQITVNGAGFTTGCATVNTCMLIWGTDETTALANASTALFAACSSMILPAINPEGTGPAVILVSSGPIFSTSTTACLGTGGSRSGFAIIGGGPQATYIMPVPNFTTASCTGGSSGHACFVDGPDGGFLQGFTIHGGGFANFGGNSSTLVLLEVDSANNSYMRDMEFLFWGGGAGAGTGIQFEGGEILTYNVGEDGFGSVGRRYVALSNLGQVTEVLPASYDNSFINVVDQNASNPVFTSGSNLGGAGGGYLCVWNGATLISSQDIFGLPQGNGSAPTGPGVTVGGCTDMGGGHGTTAGTVTLSNDLWYQTLTSAVGMLYLNSSTSKATLSNTLVDNLSANSGTNLIYNQFGGAFIDAGGNTFTRQNAGQLSNTITAGSTYLATGHQFSGSCTGTATSSSTLGLYGTGPNETVTTCTSTTIGSGTVMTMPGTLYNLIAFASTAGVSASSGVVTVLKNGSSTTITCTIGTGTFCVDGTHAVAYVAGDLISLQFTTQATETLAGVKASVVF